MISVTEDEFNAVASAAVDAFNDGDIETAERLDKLARKINADLSNAHVSSITPMRTTGKPSWRDMPSTLPGRVK